MKDYFSPTEIPWLCGGNFNEFIWDYEKASRAKVLYNRPHYLEEFINYTNLLDLDFNGSAFTWKGTRNGELVE